MGTHEASILLAVRRYFAGCQSGDLKVRLGTLTKVLVRYFLRSRFRPIRGVQQLANRWRKFQTLHEPHWAIDRIIAQGDEVVSGFNCIWTAHETHTPSMMRAGKGGISCMTHGLRKSRPTSYTVISQIQSCPDFPMQRATLSLPNRVLSTW